MARGAALKGSQGQAPSQRRQIAPKLAKEAKQRQEEQRSELAKALEPIAAKPKPEDSDSCEPEYLNTLLCKTHDSASSSRARVEKWGG